MASSKQLKHLPPEIWLEIFSHLDVTLLTCPQVCWSFYGLIGPIPRSRRWSYILSEEHSRFLAANSSSSNPDGGHVPRKHLGCRKCCKLLPRERFPLSKRTARICLDCHGKAGSKRPDWVLRWVDVHVLGKSHWKWRWCETCEKWVLGGGGFRPDDAESPVEGWHTGAEKWEMSCCNVRKGVEKKEEEGAAVDGGEEEVESDELAEKVEELIFSP